MATFHRLRLLLEFVRLVFLYLLGLVLGVLDLLQVLLGLQQLQGEEGAVPHLPDPLLQGVVDGEGLLTVVLQAHLDLVFCLCLVIASFGVHL